MKGAYLDRVDVPDSGINNYLLDPIFNINDRMQAKQKLASGKKYSPSEALDESLRNAKRAPYFVTIKMGACHSPYGHRINEAETGIESGEYQEAFMRSQNELRSMVDKIVAVDPGALIVLIGDHGSWVYKGFNSGIQSEAELAKVCQTYGITKKDIADDIFGIFLAVRMPGGMSNISHAEAISTINLFWYIFAALNEDADLLVHRLPSVSEYNHYIMMREGQVVENWFEEQ